MIILNLGISCDRFLILASLENFFYLFHDGSPYHRNHWFTVTGFYMTGSSIMKELKSYPFSSDYKLGIELSFYFTLTSIFESSLATSYQLKSGYFFRKLRKIEYTRIICWNETNQDYLYISRLNISFQIKDFYGLFS